jgi:hypothetical protein
LFFGGRKIHPLQKYQRCTKNTPPPNKHKMYDDDDDDDQRYLAARYINNTHA